MANKRLDEDKALAGYVNRFSVLIDNMYVNEHPLHRKSAAFTLTMFTVLMQLSFSEKEWHILSLKEKYKDKSKDTVINFLVDVISQSDDYYNADDVEAEEVLRFGYATVRDNLLVRGLGRKEMAIRFWNRGITQA